MAVPFDGDRREDERLAPEREGGLLLVEAAVDVHAARESDGLVEGIARKAEVVPDGLRHRDRVGNRLERRGARAARGRVGAVGGDVETAGDDAVRPIAVVVDEVGIDGIVRGVRGGRALVSAVAVRIAGEIDVAGGTSAVGGVGRVGGVGGVARDDGRVAPAAAPSVAGASGASAVGMLASSSPTGGSLASSELPLAHAENPAATNAARAPPHARTTKRDKRIVTRRILRHAARASALRAWSTRLRRMAGRANLPRRTSRTRQFAR